MIALHLIARNVKHVKIVSSLKNCMGCSSNDNLVRKNSIWKKNKLKNSVDHHPMPRRIFAKLPKYSAQTSSSVASSWSPQSWELQDLLRTFVGSGPMMSGLNLHEVCPSATPTDVTKHVIEILLVEATRPLRRSIDGGCSWAKFTGLHVVFVKVSLPHRILRTSVVLWMSLVYKSTHDCKASWLHHVYLDTFRSAPIQKCHLYELTQFARRHAHTSQ